MGSKRSVLELGAGRRVYILKGLQRRACPVEAVVDDLTSLVGAAWGGDLGAYDQLVRRYQDMSVGYAYSQLGDFHLAEDASRPHQPPQRVSRTRQLMTSRFFRA